MSLKTANRILHVDADSFFASCEIALDPGLEGKPVWVGGGRRGDGIVIAANRVAKGFGIKTGTACFEARHLCPHGVLCRPHYDKYRDLSEKMFHILEQYSPLLLPISVDEAFLDLSGIGNEVLQGRSIEQYVNTIRQHVMRELRLPVSAGLASSAKLAKLATDAAKPGFLEIQAGSEKSFLKDRSVRELSGVGDKTEASLARIGIKTFGDAASTSAMFLHKKFGIWGQELWLLANGLWSAPLVIENKDRTTISSSTTLPKDEPDYEAVLTFVHSETLKLIGQLRQENMQPKELQLAIRFFDFSEESCSFKLQHPSFQNSIIGGIFEEMYWNLLSGQSKSIRQVRLVMQNLSPIDIQPSLWGRSLDERVLLLDKASEVLKAKFGSNAVKTGYDLALEQLETDLSKRRSKCPFIPKREMISKLGLLSRMDNPQNKAHA